MMAQSRAESTRDTYNYGQYLNQFPQNTIKVIREFERIQKKICRHKMSIMFNEICIYIYIYIYMCVCVCVCVCVWVCVFGAFNSFPYFFVQAFKIVVDSWKFSMYEMTDQYLWFQVQMNSYSSNWNTPDCHSWWISEMQSDTLELRYAIKFCFKLG